MGFFPPRYYFHNYNNRISKEVSAEKPIPKPEEDILPKENREVQEERSREETVKGEVEVKKEAISKEEGRHKEEGTVKKENINEKENSERKKESTRGHTENSQGTEKAESFNISEKLIANLTATETNLTLIKGRVDSTKGILDDLIYKLESFLQIVEIIRANEERRISAPQAQVATLKTSKDSIDELLELLQGPVFQNVLRQIFISTLVKNGKGTY